MRRKDREVTDFAEIIDILERCNTIRLGIHGTDAPYIVPLSFGLEVIGNKPIVYFHCAQEGLKIELLEKSSNVCVEGDIFHKVEKTEHGITTRYESIIAQGKCEFVTAPDDIKHGLRLINQHYGYGDYPLDRCNGLAHLKIGKITLHKITGKRNLA